ncbi:hypothetical protein [Streptosporangium canum]|uniref:hypothetical protein n=1 Tax=Streptosporangium canum TaxID=324952 RepID=UPI0037AB08FF
MHKVTLGGRATPFSVDEVRAQPPGLAGLAEAGEAAGESFEQDAQLQLGEVVAEAKVRAERGVPFYDGEFC